MKPTLPAHQFMALEASVRFNDELMRQRRAIAAEQRKREERLWADDETRDVHEQLDLMLEEQQ